MTQFVTSPPVIASDPPSWGPFWFSRPLEIVRRSRTASGWSSQQAMILRAASKTASPVSGPTRRTWRLTVIQAVFRFETSGPA